MSTISRRKIVVLVVAAILAAAAYPLTAWLLSEGRIEIPAPAAMSTGMAAVAIAAWFTLAGRWHSVGFRAVRGTAVARGGVAATIVAVLAITASALGGLAQRSPLSVAAVAIFCALVAFVEESIFRGVLANLFLRRRGLVAAVIWPSVIFGLVHAINAFDGQDLGGSVLQVGFALAFGVFCQVAYFALDSIWPTVIFHLLYNFTELMGNHLTSSAALWVNVAILLAAAAALFPMARRAVAGTAVSQAS